MLGKQLTLFKLLGIDIKVDLSWLFLAFLVTWSLAQGLFPFLYEGLEPGIYWRMGILGAFGLFVSIVLHELSHCVVARCYGIPIKGITLFIFGGVAEMENEPPSARAEFRMAIAGPLASAALALGFHLLHGFAESADAPPSILGVLYYLALINALLAAFNMIPAFPLDGGRVLRAVLWARKGDLTAATDTASKIGSGFGLLLIAFGLVNVLRGNLVGGMWWFLIGMFMRQAAGASQLQLLAGQFFGDAPISRFMSRDPVSVPGHISVASLIEDYMYRTHHEFYPVLENGLLVGGVGVVDVKMVPPEARNQTTVARIMRPLGPDIAVPPAFEAMKALALMRRTDSSRLLVVADGHLLGIITLKDMLAFLTLRINLES